MNETSRRGFMAVAGAGAAGTVVLGAGSSDAAGALDGKPVQDSVVAWIPDHHADRIHLMFGEREVVVHDRALVRRILSAAGGK